MVEGDLHDLVSGQCSLQPAFFMHASGAGCTMQQAQAEVMKYVAMFKKHTIYVHSHRFHRP